jgi:hypothetical protein
MQCQLQQLWFPHAHLHCDHSSSQWWSSMPLQQRHDRYSALQQHQPLCIGLCGQLDGRRMQCQLQQLWLPHAHLHCDHSSSHWWSSMPLQQRHDIYSTLQQHQPLCSGLCGQLDSRCMQCQLQQLWFPHAHLHCDHSSSHWWSSMPIQQLHDRCAALQQQHPLCSGLCGQLDSRCMQCQLQQLWFPHAHLHCDHSSSQWWSSMPCYQRHDRCAALQQHQPLCSGLC